MLFHQISDAAAPLLCMLRLCLYCCNAALHLSPKPRPVLAAYDVQLLAQPPVALLRQIQPRRPADTNTASLYGNAITLG